MKNYSEPKIWDVWLARVKYEDMDASKIRPILVIDEELCFVLSLKMTSHDPRKNIPGEYQMKLWKEAGLNKPTVIRVNKRFNLSKKFLMKRIGVLQNEDMMNVKLLYESIYGILLP